MGTSSGKRCTAAFAASLSLTTEGRMRCCAAHSFIRASRPRFTPSVFLSCTRTVPLAAPSLAISMGYRHSIYSMRSEASLLSSIATDSRESEAPPTLLKTVEVTRGKARLFWQDKERSRYMSYHATGTCFRALSIGPEFPWLRSSFSSSLLSK